tara:strand:+ start:644 stop:1303 length:660 start_codon:yes stop_codon:yes gene_type:complete
MANGVIENLGSNILNGYNLFLSSMPPFAQSFINLFLIVLFIVVYSIFIWKFYRFIATKNIIELNLGKYKSSGHPFFEKITAWGLYFLEYLIILPFLIFFWFSIFTIFLALLTQKIDISLLLVLSATIIAAIRMTSYYKEDLAKDLAKLVPFTLLAVSLLNPDFFSFERILTNFLGIQNYFAEIFTYLTFIITLEIVLRFFDFIFSLFGLEERVAEEAEK